MIDQCWYSYARLTEQRAKFLRPEEMAGLRNCRSSNASHPDKENRAEEAPSGSRLLDLLCVLRILIAHQVRADERRALIILFPALVGRSFAVIGHEGFEATWWSGRAHLSSAGFRRVGQRRFRIRAVHVAGGVIRPAAFFIAASHNRIYRCLSTERLALRLVVSVIQRAGAAVPPSAVGAGVVRRVGADGADGAYS